MDLYETFARIKVEGIVEFRIWSDSAGGGEHRWPTSCTPSASVADRSVPSDGIIVGWTPGNGSPSPPSASSEF